MQGRQTADVESQVALHLVEALRRFDEEQGHPFAIVLLDVLDDCMCCSKAMHVVCWWSHWVLAGLQTCLCGSF